jgi:hypothetical protein
MAKRRRIRIGRLKNVTRPKGSAGLSTSERYWLVQNPDEPGGSLHVILTATTLEAAKNKKRLFEKDGEPLRIVDVRPDFSTRSGRK